VNKAAILNPAVEGVIEERIAKPEAENERLKSEMERLRGLLYDRKQSQQVHALAVKSTVVTVPEGSDHEFKN